MEAHILASYNFSNMFWTAHKKITISNVLFIDQIIPVKDFLQQRIAPPILPVITGEKASSISSNSLCCDDSPQTRNELV
jgi:hypothetical protein